MSKKILIVIPELSYSGSVYSSYRISKVLIKYKYMVDVISYEEGKFQNEFEKIGIVPIVIDKNNIYDNIELENIIKSYDLVIANTVIVYAFADVSKNITPTIWYIREAQNLSWQFCKYDYRRYYALKRAENIYAVSEYAAEYICANYNENVHIIHNCVEDEKDIFEKQISDAKVRFLALGTIEPRKAYDILINAFDRMCLDKSIDAELHFAGRHMNYADEYYNSVVASIEGKSNIKYHGEIQERDKLLQLMANCDVVVVPSKDESCSLVALEAAMMSKPLIVSENVGAKYLISDDCGWIFKTDDEEDLSNVLKECVKKRDELQNIGIKLRNQYEKTSTFEIYEKNILEMVKDNMVEDIEGYRDSHFELRKIECIQREEEEKSLKPIYSFGVVPARGEKAAIYGAGEVGKALADYCKANEIKFIWADKNQVKQKNGIEGSTIVAPDQMGEIVKKEKLNVYVAISSRPIFTEIMEELLLLGVDGRRIIWSNPKLIRK